MLLSDPEPSWVTPDTHQRFIQAKSTLKASQDQALMTHKWRQKFGVDTILERPPGPWWEFVTENFRAQLVHVTPDGDPVLFIKLCDVKRLSDAIRAGKGTLRDIEEHLAFINEYTYKVAAPYPVPGGMGIQVIDCAGAKLSMINSDAIGIFKVFASFGLYYPERMNKAVVINAPSWFDMPWRIAYNILDENTRSKVVLEFNSKKVTEALEDVLGRDNVPQEYGGPCATPLDASPEMQRLQAFVAELRAGGNPFARIAKETPQP
ncbi:MAG: CRAL-TRIO domain-containing protein [Monoraphidium minutum]|nr:MAG: CRAL-TRIO domain-containing protein [Monoraphidium minutum]